MKIRYIIFLFVFLCVQLSAQDGLEGIIVEKYYVSDENDKSVDGDGGELPLNSVTYRVFVDMKPGYIFQAAYGTPEHNLKIATTTRFFNNIDRGARFPTYTRNLAQNNTVMLDSWLSVGAALKDYAGVLKDKDDGVNTIVNADGVLQNDHTQAGIPLSQEDGAVLATTQSVTVVGFFDTDLSIFDDTNESPIPTVLSTNDGAWSSLTGSMGPDSLENVVLIGQFTTDGVFEFQLNVQIRNQQTLEVETYVASNPTGNEIQFADLIHIDSLETGSSTRNFIGLNDRINVYPNPTSGHLSVSIDGDLSPGTKNIIAIKGIDGSTLFNGLITDSVTSLDLSNLVPGVYLLSIELDGYLFVEKVTKTP